MLQVKQTPVNDWLMKLSLRGEPESYDTIQAIIQLDLLLARSKSP